MSLKGLFNLEEILERVESELTAAGIAVDFCGDVDACASEGRSGPRVKMVCIPPGLKEALRKMSGEVRDQVVMVRVDAETSAALDAWVETGAVKSRSEAAALFIREGLDLRSDELASLKDALDDVNNARERLHKQAREVFGSEAAEEKNA